MQEEFVSYEKIPVDYDSCKTGKFCRGKCSNYKAVLDFKGQKKYIRNHRCGICNKWVEQSKVLLVGIYHRCPCCNMRVRTKRQASLSPSEKK